MESNFEMESFLRQQFVSFYWASEAGAERVLMPDDPWACHNKF